MRDENFASIADWFTTYFFGVGIALLLVFDAAAWVGEDFVLASRVAAFGLLFAGASTVVGWVFGLLFGIPRTLARPQPALVSTPAAQLASPGNTQPSGSMNSAEPSSQPGQAPAPVAGQDFARSTPQTGTSRVNTNLEDISDWLTKTIIGVGLTQLYHIPGYMLHVAQVLNSRGVDWDYGEILSLVVPIYFGVGGFWLGYVGTRTILTRFFDIVDRPAIDPDQAAAARSPGSLRLTLDARKIAPTENPDVAQADRALLRMPREALKSTADLVAWSLSHARAQNYGLAAAGLEDVLRGRPADAGTKQQLATVYTAAGRAQDAARVLEDSPPSEVGLVASLALAPPQGFDRAIQLGEGLLLETGRASDARLWVRLAQAYGQKHAYLKEQNKAAEEIKQARDRVVVTVQEAVRLDPQVKSYLQALWKPGVGGEQRADLASLDKDDPDLSRLLDMP